LGDLRIGIALPLSGGGGKRLGNRNIDAVRDQAVAATKAISDRYAENMLPIIRQIQASGAMSLRAIANLVYIPSLPGLKRTSGLAARLSAHMLYLGNTLACAFMRLSDGRHAAHTFCVASCLICYVASGSAGGDWIKNGDNLLVFGESGTGKSHALAAICHALIDAGKRVLFTQTIDMVQRLQIARRDGG
jgi:hypothetical protein